MWVFGYGSLLWNPGFEYVERRRATLSGFRRAFRLWSWHYRGTRERPGLVLGLDAEGGAECCGAAFQVASERRDQVLAYLRERELVSYSYEEQVKPVRLWSEGDDASPSGPQVDAICYVIDRGHEQYAGRLSLERQAEVIAVAAGPAGPNADYLRQTVEHLADIGIGDAELRMLDGMVRARLTAGIS